jgi:hypothetical protein
VQEDTAAAAAAAEAAAGWLLRHLQEYTSKKGVFFGCVALLHAIRNTMMAKKHQRALFLWPPCEPLFLSVTSRQRHHARRRKKRQAVVSFQK